MGWVTMAMEYEVLVATLDTRVAVPEDVMGARLVPLLLRIREFPDPKLAIVALKSYVAVLQVTERVTFELEKDPDPLETEQVYPLGWVATATE